MLFKIERLVTLLLIFCLFHLATFAQNNSSKLKQLSHEADIILMGKVIKQNSSWNENKTKIYTNVTVEVDELLKGQNGDKNIIIRHPGGEVGEVGELYSHMPKFSNDEEILLFAKRDEQDLSYKVIKGEEGKLTLYYDQQTGEKVTSSNKKVSVLKNEIKNYVEQQ